jgi:hypothetical protein
VGKRQLLQVAFSTTGRYISGSPVVCTVIVFGIAAGIGFDQGSRTGTTAAPISIAIPNAVFYERQGRGEGKQDK